MHTTNYTTQKGSKTQAGVQHLYQLLEKVLHVAMSRKYAIQMGSSLLVYREHTLFLDTI